MGFRSILFTLGLALAVPSSGWAHSTHREPSVRDLPASVRALESYLSSPAAMEGLSAQVLHRILLEEVEKDLLAPLHRLEEISRARWLWRQVDEHVLSRFNLVQVSKWVKETAKTKGSRFVAAWAVTEAVENALIVYAAMNPEHAYLIPVSFSHSLDFLGYGIVFGVPELVRHFGRVKDVTGSWWNLRAYYHHLVRRGGLEPLLGPDVLTILPSTGRLVLRKSRLERWTPRSWAPYLNPARTALRARASSYALDELERIAKNHGVDLRQMEVLRGIPQVYAWTLGSLLEREGRLGDLRCSGLFR